MIRLLTSQNTLCKFMCQFPPTGFKILQMTADICKWLQIFAVTISIWNILFKYIFICYDWLITHDTFWVLWRNFCIRYWSELRLHSFDHKPEKDHVIGWQWICNLCLVKTDLSFWLGDLIMLTLLTLQL